MLAVKKSTINRILSNKKILESKLNIKFEILGNNIELIGDSVDIYSSERVVMALDRNFSIDISFLLLNSQYILEDIPIKRFVRKTRNLKEVKARIIGKGARAIQLISELSECYISLQGNIVSIIGTADKIVDAENAITNLIQGAKHSNVYSYLEEARKKSFPESLGLKN